MSEKSGWEELTALATEYVGRPQDDPRRNELLSEIVERSQPYLCRLATRLLSGRGVPVSVHGERRVIMAGTTYATIDDLMQEGSVALVKSLGRYDPSRGYSFSTYLHFVATGAMSKASRASYGPLIAVPQKGGPGHPVVSLDEPIFENVTVADTIGAEDRHPHEHEMRSRAEHYASMLRGVELEAVRLHFGLDGPPMSREEIARKFNLSATRVRSVIDKAMRKIRFYELRERVVKPLRQ